MTALTAHQAPRAPCDPLLDPPSLATVTSTLAESFVFCSQEGMERERLSSILLNAPTWARLGLAVRDPRLRERAADALAATIVQRLEEPARAENVDQLALPL